MGCTLPCKGSLGRSGFTPTACSTQFGAYHAVQYGALDGPWCTPPPGLAGIVLYGAVGCVAFGTHSYRAQGYTLSGGELLPPVQGAPPQCVIFVFVSALPDFLFSRLTRPWRWLGSDSFRG